MMSTENAVIEGQGRLEAIRDQVVGDYLRKTPGSAALHERARLALAGGVSGNLRYFSPYPLYTKSAEGSRLIDVDDNEQRLTAYAEKFQPRYRLRRDLSPADRQVLTTFLNQHLQTTEPPLPSTIVTDGEGNTLQVTAGLPSASEIRKLVLRQ